MTTEILERTIVVTCPVPSGDLEDFELACDGDAVTVIGPGGFAQELELPGADLSRLGVELYRGYLELRAPRIT